MKCTLAAKFLEGNLVILDSMAFWSHKTGDLLKVLEKWDLRNAILVHGDDERDPNIQLAARNINYFHFLPAKGANVYELVKTDMVFMTETALQQLIHRLGNKPLGHKRITFPGFEQLAPNAELAQISPPTQQAATEE